MKKAYFRSCGGLYLIGKVRKNYDINDCFKLKCFRSTVKVVERNHNDIIVKVKEKPLNLAI